MARSLVSNGAIRAATFFALAFVLMTVGGFAIGDPRTGVRWGLGLGVAFAVFAYVFIRPTNGPDAPSE